MNWYTQASIIANDLNSMIHRIEALPAHPRMTDALVAVQDAEKALREAHALVAVQDAEKALREAQALLHEIEIGKRYDV